MNRKPKTMTWSLGLSLALALGRPALASETNPPVASDPKHAMTLELGSMWLNSLVGDMNAVSLGLERRLGAGPFSLSLSLHGGYNADEFDTSYAFGAGLGVRRYIGHLFEGSYVTARTDYTQGQTSEKIWYYDGMPPPQDQTRKHWLSMTQVGCGYKWQTEYFVVDASLGGAFYITSSEKFTNLIAGLNVGAPF